MLCLINRQGYLFQCCEWTAMSLGHTCVDFMEFSVYSAVIVWSLELLW